MPSKKQRAKAKKAAAAAPNDTKQPKLEGQPQTLKQAFRAAHRAVLKDRCQLGHARLPPRCKEALDNINYSDESRESGGLLRQRLRTKLEQRVAAVEADPYSGYITQEDEVLAD